MGWPKGKSRNNITKSYKVAVVTSPVTETLASPVISAELRTELGNVLDAKQFITVNFYDNDCHTVYSGHWDGKMVKAAIRSIERGYMAQRHMVTKEAARARMKLATNGGSDEQR